MSNLFCEKAYSQVYKKRLKINWRLQGHFLEYRFECLFVPFFAGKTVLNAASWVIRRKRFDHVILYVTHVYIKQSKHGG